MRSDSELVALANESFVAAVDAGRAAGLDYVRAVSMYEAMGFRAVPR
jgi:hypothetical protein